MPMKNNGSSVKNYLFVPTALEHSGTFELFDIVYAGEWCLPSAQFSDMSEAEYKMHPFLWADKRKIHDAYIYCDSAYIKILKILVPRLNKSVGKEYPDIYWESIIGPWLYQYVQVMFDKYKMVISAVKEYSDISSVALNEANYWIIFGLSDCEYNDDIFNLQLYSIVARYLGLETLEYTDGVDCKKKDTVEMHFNIKNFLLYKISSCLQFFFGRKKILVSYPYFKDKKLKTLLRLVWSSRFSIVYLAFYKKSRFNAAKNEPLRKVVSRPSGTNSEFLDLIFKSFEYNFPLLYLELHNEFRKHVDDYSLNNFDAFYSNTGLWVSEEFKFLVAAERLKSLDGARILYGQHGGNYGTDVGPMPETIERRLSDVFLTYGWASKNTRVLPSQSIGRYPDKPKIPIYLVLTAPSRHFVMFQHMSTSTRAIGNLANTIEFTRNLEPKNFLLVRDHPGMATSGWNEKDTLIKAIPGIKFCQKENFYSQVSRTEIVVFNHMHTAYLETLSANIPTVIFIPWEDYNFRDDAEELINGLVKVNIVFKDPVEAAEHINQYYKNVREWWDDPLVQAARIAFCNSYHVLSNNWAEDSSAVLLRLADKKVS